MAQLAREFTVNRKKWLTGTQIASKEVKDACLLDPGTGRMCCMGFYAIACGLESKDIENIGELEETGLELASNQSELANILVDIYLANDDQEISDTLRERQLVDLLKEIHITVHFVT